jgi:hypothetical protein
MGIGVNDEVSGIDMPRVSYNKIYDPNQIPALKRADRQRADIVGYISAPGPKAMAFHPWGKVFAAISGASSVAAQAQALAACNDDPARHGASGPCFVYAVDNQVVLPKRATKPIEGMGGAVTQISTAPSPAPTQPGAQMAMAPQNQPQNQPQTLSRPGSSGAAPSYATPRDALIGKMAALAPRVSGQSREARAREYLDRASGHKSLLVSLAPAGIWLMSGATDVGIAEENGFERCQMFFGAPCVEIALDDDIKSDPRPGDARDMPRVTFSGGFEPGQIPGLSDADRARADVLGYAAATSLKASAIHPIDGKIFIVTGAASERAAQQRALAACKADPMRGEYGTCFIYSVGNDVVLPQRRTDPL